MYSEHEIFHDYDAAPKTDKQGLLSNLMQIFLNNSEHLPELYAMNLCFMDKSMKHLPI
jgi:hypothetical protein